MPSWGRNAVPLAGIVAPPRYGLRSILCAILAFSLVIAALIFMVNVPNDAPETLADAATFTMLGTYLVVAPLLHIAGAVFAILGLARGDSRIRCVVGLLLNIVLVMMGAGMGWLALGGVGAYT